MNYNYRRFMALLDRLATHKVPQMLGTVVSAVAIALGISMYVDPSVFISAPSLATVFQFASPYAWGTVYIVSAIAVLLAIYINPRTAPAPVFMLGATFAMQGMLTIPEIANGAIPSSLYLYIGVGWICFIIQLICGARKVPDVVQKTPLNNKS